MPVALVLLGHLLAPVTRGVERRPLARQATDLRVGKLEWVFNHAQEARYRLRNYSDMAVPVMRLGGRYYWWITALRRGVSKTTTSWSYRFSGRRLTLMRPDPAGSSGGAIPVLTNDPDSFDNHYVGITATYYDRESGKLYAWYHAEDDQFPKEVIAAAPRNPPYYTTIGSAVSTDLGKTFTKTGQVLTAEATKAELQEATQADPAHWNVDMGNPSVMRRGQYLYLYYADQSAFPFAGIAVARLAVEDLDMTPQPWQKYFGGSFNEPGIGGRFDVVADGIYASVKYSGYLHRLVMVSAGPDEQKISLRLSRDGLRWARSIRLVGGKSPNWNLYPALVGRGKDPERLGRSVWLYYSRSPNIRKVGTRLGRRVVSLAKAADRR